MLQIEDQLADQIARSGLSPVADHGKVFSHLNLIQPQKLGDGRRADMGVIFSRELAQQAQVGRKPEQRLLGYAHGRVHFIAPFTIKSPDI